MIHICQWDTVVESGAVKKTKDTANNIIWTLNFLKGSHNLFVLLYIKYNGFNIWLLQLNFRSVLGRYVGDILQKNLSLEI